MATKINLRDFLQMNENSQEKEVTLHDLKDLSQTNEKSKERQVTKMSLKDFLNYDFSNNNLVREKHVIHLLLKNNEIRGICKRRFLAMRIANKQGYRIRSVIVPVLSNFYYCVPFGDNFLIYTNEDSNMFNYKNVKHITTNEGRKAFVINDTIIYVPQKNMYRFNVIKK